MNPTHSFSLSISTRIHFLGTSSKSLRGSFIIIWKLAYLHCVFSLLWNFTMPKSETQNETVNLLKLFFEQQNSYSKRIQWYFLKFFVQTRYRKSARFSGWYWKYLRSFLNSDFDKLETFPVYNLSSINLRNQGITNVFEAKMFYLFRQVVLHKLTQMQRKALFFQPSPREVLLS